MLLCLSCFTTWACWVCRRDKSLVVFTHVLVVFTHVTVKGGTQHSVVALSTLVTHIITVVLEVLQLEGGAMIFVEDQVQYILLISICYNNCFIYSNRVLFYIVGDAQITLFCLLVPRSGVGDGGMVGFG